MSSRLQDVILRGLAAARPLATAVPPGTLYFSSDTSVTERSNGSAWESYTDAGGGGGGGPHATTHQNAGSDVVDVKLLGGFPGGITTFLRADRTFAAPTAGLPGVHATTHIKGGSDPIEGTLLLNNTSELKFKRSTTGEHSAWKMDGNFGIITEGGVWVPETDSGGFWIIDSVALLGYGNGRFRVVDWNYVSDPVRLEFGGVTAGAIVDLPSNAPMLKQVAAGLEARLINDSDLTTFRAKLNAADLVTGTIPTATLPARFGVLGMVIDGAGSVITTGIKGFLQVPFACTLLEWTLLSSDASATAGSIVVDIWKDTYANYPPTAADVITTAAKPTLSSVNKNTSSTLTGWTTSIAAGDILGFNVNSVSTVTKVTFTLKIQMV